MTKTTLVEKQLSLFRRAMEPGGSSQLRFTIFRQRSSTWSVGSSQDNRQSPKCSLRPISMLPVIVWFTAANCLLSRPYLAIEHWNWSPPIVSVSNR